jgi:hypothetical protein
MLLKHRFAVPTHLAPPIRSAVSPHAEPDQSVLSVALARRILVPGFSPSQGPAASGNSKFTLGLQHKVLCLGQLIGHGVKGGLTGRPLHENLVTAADGLDDNTGFFHSREYAQKFKLGHSG